jgi:hypothetical protein
VTIGHAAIPPDEQRLLEATVDAVARAHADAIDLTALDEPIIGVVQEVYWDGADPSHWIPTSYAIPRRKAEYCVAEGCIDGLWLPHELEDMDIELPYLGLEVEVLDGTNEMLDQPEEQARDLVEQRLQVELGRRGAGRAVVEAPLRRLPATIQGRAETFSLIAAAGQWAAAWCDPHTDLHVTVSGAGDPPPSLDLEPARL